MKYRLDFVTNSSSSSYICEICGEEETSWDTPSWLKYCVHEHAFCEDHLEENYEVDSEESYYVSENSCPICTFKTYSQSEMVEYLLKTRKIPKDEVFAEVKKANKRRRKLYDNEYIQYVFNKFDLTEDIIMDEIRQSFSNWEEYSDFIYKKED
jgi:hypothetical protein